MTTKLDVTKDRDKYIGGSDMPAVMSISPFVTRWGLLQEKALGKISDFIGNEYTEYGKQMESVIRDYINDRYCDENEGFVDDEVRIDGDLRYHADGFEKECRSWRRQSRLLEIKTTSNFVFPEDHSTETLDDGFDKDFILKHYKPYVVQILLGMMMFGCKIGMLAIYERPDDFSLELDPERLHIVWIHTEHEMDVLDEMSHAIDQFRIDRDRLKENPLLTEEELQPKELVKLADEALLAEQLVVAARKAEKHAKEVKAALKKAMEDHGVKKWTTNDGVQITLVPDGKDQTIKEFDQKRFVAENGDLAASYMREKVKKGRTGYVRITIGADE